MVKTKTLAITLLFLLLAFTGNSQDSTKFKKHMGKGEKFFFQQKYSDARKEFNKALRYFNTAQRAKDRVAFCDKRIEENKIQVAERDELSKRYNTIIKQADIYFAEHNLQKAKYFYERALMYKPDEAYPHEKIRECRMIAEFIEHEAQYTKVVKHAQALLDQKKYANAKEYFKRALSIKPNSQLCNQKINYCEEQIQIERDAKFFKLVAQGDSLLTIQDTIQAKNYYAAANAVKYDCNLKAKRGALENKFFCCAQAQAPYTQEYICAIAKGEFYMRLQKYELASKAFEEALVQSDQQYPKDMIKTCKEELEKKK